MYFFCFYFCLTCHDLFALLTFLLIAGLITCGNSWHTYNVSLVFQIQNFGNVEKSAEISQQRDVPDEIARRVFIHINTLKFGFSAFLRWAAARPLPPALPGGVFSCYTVYSVKRADLAAQSGTRQEKTRWTYLCGGGTRLFNLGHCIFLEHWRSGVTHNYYYKFP